MGSIQSLGIGSGIDVGALVSSLVSAEGASKVARLNSREAQYTAKLSSLATLKGSVSDFQSSYTALKTVSTFNAMSTTSSDSSVFTVSADKGATVGSYDIDVTTLAVAQKLQTSAGYADSNSTSIGTGTLTFAFASDIAAANGTTVDVTITDGTLQGIRDAINDADIGVSANVVFDGTDYELVMTSQTGKDNELVITQSSTTGNLSAFEYNSDSAGGPPAPSGNLNQTVAAVDAVLTVDGVGITSASNTLTSIMNDVTLTLTGIGTSEKLTISKNTSGVGSAVQSFVSGYNSLMTALNSASAYNEEGASGILIGDSTVRGIVSQLRGILNTTVGDTTTEFNSFSSIGILTKRDGTLEYDASKLTAALSSKASEVQYLLAGGRTTSSNADLSVTSIPNDVAAGSYTLDIEIGAIEIGGIEATNSGTTYLGTSALEGFELEYTGGSTGIVGSITVQDGLMDNLDTLINSFLASDGYIDAKTGGLNASIADIKTARADLNERLASYEARLLKQFNAMDTLVAQLNSTSTFLTSQLNSLSNLANGKR